MVYNKILLFLENEKSPQKRTEVKEDLLNVDLFEELNILGKVGLNKSNEIKTVRKYVIN